MAKQLPKIIIEDLAPSQNKIPEVLNNQFQYRKTGDIVGENQIVIANMLEPIWWNRPLAKNTTQLIGIEPDGLYSCNLPLFNPKLEWKAAYNVLLNKNNIPIATHLHFEEEFTETELEYLHSATLVAIYKTLLDIGIKSEYITFLNNDILLNGKKFCGIEIIETMNYYEENTFITLNYLEEKEIFERLKVGNIPPKRSITGIHDEYPELKFTKEDFINIYIKHYEEYLSKIGEL